MSYIVELDELDSIYEDLMERLFKMEITVTELEGYKMAIDIQRNAELCGLQGTLEYAIEQLEAINATLSQNE